MISGSRSRGCAASHAKTFLSRTPARSSQPAFFPVASGPKPAKFPRMKHHLDFEKPIAELQTKLEELKKHPEAHSIDISFEEEVALIEKKLEETKRQIFSNLSAWDRIKIARHPKRLFTLDYLEK